MLHIYAFFSKFLYITPPGSLHLHPFEFPNYDFSFVGNIHFQEQPIIIPLNSQIKVSQMSCFLNFTFLPQEEK